MIAEVMMNTVCNKLAGETTQATLEGEGTQGQPLLDLPYVGSKATLEIKNRYITSWYSDELYKARRAGLMREYCKYKYKWTDDVFDSIH